MTTSIESSRPGGERFFRALVDQCKAAGDTAETESLELKGADLNPTTKVGGGKIAKFLIGTANRDPKSAMRRFEGYALVVIGIEKDGSAPGIDRGMI